MHGMNEEAAASSLSISYVRVVEAFGLTITYFFN